MTTKREQVLQALHVKLQQLVGPGVERNSALPDDLPAGGLVVLRDGDAGEPEVTLSPLTYIYEHLAELEIGMPGVDQAARDAALDAVLQQLGALLSADPTLGGLCDWAEPLAPETGEATEPGAAPVKTASLPVLLIYGTSSPLG